MIFENRTTQIFPWTCYFKVENKKYTTFKWNGVLKILKITFVKQTIRFLFNDQMTTETISKAQEELDTGRWSPLPVRENVAWLMILFELFTLLKIDCLKAFSFCIVKNFSISISNRWSSSKNDVTKFFIIFDPQPHLALVTMLLRSEALILSSQNTWPSPNKAITSFMDKSSGPVCIVRYLVLANIQ